MSIFPVCPLADKIITQRAVDIHMKLLIFFYKHNIYEHNELKQFDGDLKYNPAKLWSSVIMWFVLYFIKFILFEMVFHRTLKKRNPKSPMLNVSRQLLFRLVDKIYNLTVIHSILWVNFGGNANDILFHIIISDEKVKI